MSSTTTALLHFAPLVAGNAPAIIERGVDWVLVVAEPSMTMLALTTFLVRHCTDAEQNLYRAAYGIGPIGTPIPDMWFRDEPVPPWIPESLRLDCYDLPDRRVGCPIERAAYGMLNQQQSA